MINRRQSSYSSSQLQFDENDLLIKLQPIAVTIMPKADDGTTIVIEHLNVTYFKRLISFPGDAMLIDDEEHIFLSQSFRYCIFYHHNN